MGAPVAPERRRRVQGFGRDAITQMKRRTEKETEGTLGAALLSLQRQTRAGVVAASVSGMVVVLFFHLSPRGPDAWLETGCRLDFRVTTL